MILIPAIDLHDGQCVQLKRGVLDSATVYANDPGALSTHWCDQGARRIHVVDLDGAFAGETKNLEGIKAIVNAAGDIPVQLGGGIRTMETVEKHLEVGVSQICIGTQAIEDPTFFNEAAQRYPDQIILALDARSGFVSTRGWQTDTNIPVDDVLSDCADLPLFGLVFTDINSDGMMTGVNIDRTKDVLRKTPVPVIASGGVKGMADLERIRQLGNEFDSLYGVISGSALYERAFDFRRGQRVLDIAH